VNRVYAAAKCWFISSNALPPDFGRQVSGYFRVVSNFFNRMSLNSTIIPAS
jgi:hypothetical protein